MKREVYYRGIQGVKWGIWNVQKKCFQFGICRRYADVGRSPIISENRGRCKKVEI